MKCTCALLALNSLVLIGLQPQIATATTLYTGEDLPEKQGWLVPGAIQSNGVPISDISDFQTVDPVTEAFTLQTNDIDSNSDSFAGYLGYTNNFAQPPSFSELQLVNSGFPELNADEGYSIFFYVAINSLIEDNLDRAAFSILAISSNVTKGIELDFEEDLIFAQSNTLNSTGASEFVRAETSTPIVTGDSNSYELRVNPSTYELFANGDRVLDGSLRDYEFDINATDPSLPFNPYETPNFLFFGDLTDEAAGEFTLGEVRVEVATASTPEANFTLALALIGIGFTTKKILKKKIYTVSHVLTREIEMKL